MFSRSTKWGLAVLVGTALATEIAHAEEPRSWIDPPRSLPLQLDEPAAAKVAGEVAAPRAPEAVGANAATHRQADVDPTATQSIGARGRTGRSMQPAPVGSAGEIGPRLASRAVAARDLAYDYLELWSSGDEDSIASLARFYRASVVFHGKVRNTRSVMAEKRRFAERWPARTYRYRPETIRIACEADAAQCTVWSIFDYSAGEPRSRRRARGIGEHELVVSFDGSRPIIASENSRVLHRGAVQHR